MAEQAWETEVRSDKRSQHDIEPAISGPGDEVPTREQPPSGLWRAAGANSVEAQAAWLNNKRLQSAQRRILANHIGYVQGNYHLQKVMASLRRKAESQDSAEDLGLSGISDPPTGAAAEPSPSGQADLHRIPPGDRGLGHELTHVVQNDQGRIPNTVSRESAISQPTDDLEKEAYTQESMIAQNVEGFRAQRGMPNTYANAVGPRRTASSRGEASPLPAPGVDMPPSAVSILGPASGPGSQGVAITKTISRPALPVAPAATAGNSGIAPAQGAARGASAAITATSLADKNGVSAVGGPAGLASGPQLDTSSSEGLLESLTETPASLFGAAVGMAQSVTSQVQAQEKAALEASFPEVEQPTGLPVRPEQSPPPATVLALSQAPTQQLASGSPVGAASETTTVVAAGPLPAHQVSTAASEPAEEHGGSWWDWLFNRVSNFVASLPTSDPGLSTSAGQRPRVDLSGEANPAQNAEYHQASDAEVAAHQAEADVATTGDFGEQDIYPTVPTEKLRPTFKPSAPSGVRGGVARHPPELPEATRAEFDQGASPLLSAKVQEQIAKYRQDQEASQKQSQQARDEGERRIAEATAQARAEQEGLRAQARSEVDVGREQWRAENRKIQEAYATRTTAKRVEIDQQIQDRVATTEARADAELAHAESKADAERSKAETQAAQKKQEAESKPKSFWESVKGVISNAFAAIKSEINSIFDELRRVVKSIIETAKSVVRGLIDAARDAIVGLIKTFGEFVKGLVTVALAAFPEAAAKMCAWIDGKVEAATDAVNQAAEALKKATNAILDGVGQTLDAALSLLQSTFNAILDTLEFLTQRIVEGLELLVQLQELVSRFGLVIRRIKALIEDPAPVIEAIRAYIGSLIAKVPNLAQAAAQKAITFSEPPRDHWTGIWEHLKPKLDYLAANWWGVIKDTAWTLIWPFAKDAKTGERPLFKDVEEILRLMTHEIPRHIWQGRLSKAVDGLLRIQQLCNNVVGMFYGWIFIGLVVGGGILGSEAGVLPGMAAGASVALTVGQGLLWATVATEGAILAKSGFNLIYMKQSPKENEEDYERIASSALLLGIMGALALLGAIAARFGKAVLSAAGRFVRAVVSTVLGPQAAALLEVAFNRIRAEVAAILERFRKEGKFKFRSSGIGASTYEGPALKLHPERFEQIINDLERQGVKINVMDSGDPWTGSYAPGGSKGEPGSLRVHRDVDIRTLEHEYQHFLDDKARGFPGLRFWLENPAEMYELERIAYSREMDLVRADPSLSAEEKAAIIKELEAALEQEKIRYLSPQE